MNKNEAIAKAKKIAEEQNWPWREPFYAILIEETTSGWFSRKQVKKLWRVVSNANKIGANVNITIDNDSGEVVHKAYSPR